MRMSVAVDPVSGGTTNPHQSSPPSVAAGGPSSGDEELLVVNTVTTNSSSTPSPSPTPGGTGLGGSTSSSSLLTTSTALSASTTTMVGQHQPTTITSTAATQPTNTNFDDVVKTGNLRKVKGRKKYFVLRKESENGSVPARLEYYANERKFKLGQSPKKSIILKHCFNISRTDSKCKYAIALHTHNDCVRIAMSSEEEMNEWLRTINSLAGDDEDEFLGTAMPTADEHGGGGTITTTTGLIPKPHFEHVWLVTALNKGLGSKENIIGPYRLCLTSKELTLLKVGDHEEKNSVGILKFPLNVIRNVSHDATFGCFFHIEFGRLAPTGPGQLSLKTEDNNIAQNMHLLILKAMQNYSKDDMIPRETRRGRTYTWNSAYNESNSSLGSRHNSLHHGPNSHHGTTPPIMTRINSMDGSTMRLRTESIGSQESRTTGMSPPMPIMGHNNSLMNPSLSFNSPMCSTTDSASSSYSNDYENNNNGGGSSSRLLTAYHHQQQHSYGKSQDEEEDESYVPWNPADDQHHTSSTTAFPPSSSSLLTLHLKQNSINSNSRNDGNASHNEDDYVETTVGSGGGVITSSTSATPSSHIDTQSPISPFDNYLPMSPGTPLSSGENAKHPTSTNTSEKNKTSVPHSRTSSNAIEEHEGYVPMLPGTQQRDTSAGSATGLDESYFDMDFSKKLNLSNDDFRRMSPASSESLQSSTPSSDFPLEKVSSYLLSSDDLDDSSGRPMRAYSVGSRSDTTAIGKGRFGKNRLEAVQETFRMRALSVGAKVPKPNVAAAATKTTPEAAKKEKASTASITSISSSITAPLSNSWSGSTGKWPPHKFSSPAPIPASVTTPQMPTVYHHSQHNSDSVDPDLMELDFSHNKKNRKRSLPGSTHLSLASGGNQGSVGSSIGSGGPKLSPALLKSGCETPETPSEGSKGSPFIHQYGSSPGVPSSKYPCSAPISIQKTKSSCGDEGDYMDTSGSGVSILTRMTGLAVKEIKQLDNEGAYLDMNFSKPTTPAAAPSSRVSTTASVPVPPGKNGARSNPVVVKPNESVPPSVFTLSTTSGTTPATHCVSSSPKLAFFGLTSSPSGGAAPLSYFGTPSPLQGTTHKSTVSPPSASLLHPPVTAPASSTTTSSSPNSTSSLSRIEESPEKQELSLSRSTSQTEDDGSSKITYASIDHSCLESTSPQKRPLATVPSLICGKSASEADSSKVTYSEVEFVKSSEPVKRN